MIACKSHPSDINTLALYSSIYLLSERPAVKFREGSLFHYTEERREKVRETSSSHCSKQKVMATCCLLTTGYHR